MSMKNKLYITAVEMAEILGISQGHAYKLIRQMNDELSKKGFLVISGKVSRSYFEQRWYDLGA